MQTSFQLYKIFVKQSSEHKFLSYRSTFKGFDFFVLIIEQPIPISLGEMNCCPQHNLKTAKRIDSTKFMSKDYDFA